jgi:hypothetical protein
VGESRAATSLTAEQKDHTKERGHNSSPTKQGHSEDKLSAISGQLSAEDKTLRSLFPHAAYTLVKQRFQAQPGSGLRESFSI